MTFDQWTRLLLALAAPIGAIAVAIVAAGRDLDQRRRKRAYLLTELDLLDRLRALDQQAPFRADSAAGQMQRSIDLRVRRISADEEPFTSGESLARRIGLWGMVAAWLVGSVATSGFRYDNGDPVWPRFVFGAIFAAGGLAFLATDVLRDRRRRHIIGRPNVTA